MRRTKNVMPVCLRKIRLPPPPPIPLDAESLAELSLPALSHLSHSLIGGHIFQVSLCADNQLTTFREVSAVFPMPKNAVGTGNLSSAASTFNTPRDKLSRASCLLADDPMGSQKHLPLCDVTSVTMADVSAEYNTAMRAMQYLVNHYRRQKAIMMSISSTVHMTRTRPMDNELILKRIKVHPKPSLHCFMWFRVSYFT
uniref:Proteasome assembly chaperone 3 n=1 Tax=Steinernema glaseri TaxID=37863 RepID=A0A1I7Z049_9BILA